MVRDDGFMRVLVSTTAGSGHFGPLVPFAAACRDAGHDVRVAAPASFASAVTRAGFEHARFPDVPPDVMGPIFGRLPELPPGEADRVVVTEIFGRLDAQAALPALRALVEEWRPDVVLRESCEFGSLAAAEAAGVPHVQVSIGIGSMSRYLMGLVAEPLAELSVLAGLPEDGAMAAMISSPGFTSVPAELDGDGGGSPTGDGGESGRFWRFRDRTLATGGGSLPPSWGDQDHPLVYVTYGSVAGTLPPFVPLYAATLDVLASAAVRVLMTTGDGDDGVVPPERVPANAHVERWWPQTDVMHHAAAVVGHGGFGTTMLALAAGRPQVVLPLFAFDQTVNAERVAAIGAGIHLEGGPAAVPAIPDAVADVLANPRYAASAAGVAADIAALPDVAASVPILEDLAHR